jgi:FixJ family two-component response regulator
VSEGDPTVFVVDDDPSVRKSTERLVRSMGFSVRTFESAQSFVDAARADGPACLVLDVELPGRSGLELQRELARSGVEIPIIFVTGHGDIPMTVRAMKDGAAEFLTKPVPSKELLSAIHAAIERDRARLGARRAGAALRERFERLTPREREVMALVVTGLLNKQIAGELGATERTVKFHRAHLMKKMEAESLAELVRMAGLLGIGPPEGGNRRTVMQQVEVGFQTFVADGDSEFGAVREVSRDGLVVYVENAGDFNVPWDAVRDVHFQKVILDCEKLDARLRTAIGHAHDAEAPDA